MNKSRRKNFKSRLLCGILSAAMLLANAVYAAPETNVSDSAAKQADSAEVADVIFGANVSKTNVASVHMGISDNPNVGERDGVEAWGMYPAQWKNSAYLYVDLDDNYIKNVSDGSVFDVEITYYSEGNGFFQFFYDAQRNPKRHHPTVTFTGDEKHWKTAKYTLEDAYFGNRYDDKYDFALTIRARNEQDASASDVFIREIKVTRRTAANPITFYSSIKESGSAFRWYDAEKLVTNNFENTTDKAIDAEVVYTAVTTGGYKVWQKSETVHFEPHEKKAVDVNIDTEYCNKYNYYVDVKSEKDNIDSHFQGYDFAILKTDPNGVKNYELYYATHMERGTWWSNYCEDLDKGVDVLDKSNIGGVRSTFSENDMLKGSADGNEMVWSDRFRDIYADYKRHGIKVLQNISQTGTGLLPKTDEEWNRWNTFIDMVVSNTKDVVSAYEIWNEPDITLMRANPPQSIEDFAVLSNKTYDRMKKLAPQIPVAVGSICSLMTSRSMEFLEKFLDGGAAQHSDALALHPYTTRTTEEDDMVNIMQRYIDRFDESYGKKAPIYNTECGFTVYPGVAYTQQIRTNWNIRSVLTFKGEGSNDIYTLYKFERNGPLENQREHMFGNASSGYDYDYDKFGNYYVPYESFVAVTALNYLMADSTTEGRLSEGNNEYIYRYKSNKFNKDIMALWSVFDNKQVTLNLGVNDIEYYDVYGNSKKMHSDDGRFTFLLTQKPFYIMGDFASNAAVEENIKETYSVSGAKMVYGDVMNLEIATKTDTETVEIDAPQGLDVIENKRVNNEKIRVKIRADKEYDEQIYLHLSLKDKDGDIIGYDDFPVEFFDTAFNATTSEISVSPSNVKNWSCNIDINNYSSSKALSGTLTIDKIGNRAVNKKYKLGYIPQSSVGTVSVQFPNIERYGKYPIDYTVTSTDGKSYSYTSNLNFALAQKQNGEVKIDGVLDKDEWNRDTALICDKESDIYKLNKDWNWYGPEDKSAETMLKWDEDNLYIAAEVTDDVYFQNETAANSWRCDNIQFAVYIDDGRHIAMGQAGSNFEEISLTLTDGKPEIYRTKSREGKTKLGYVTDNAELAVNQNGTKTTYEFKISWRELLGEEYAAKPGNEVGFSILFNENDGDGRMGWIEFASGIGRSKDANLFAFLKLTDN